MDTEQMEDRVHAILTADGLSIGMTSDEALRWADSRMKSTRAAMIRLDLAGRDLTEAIRVAADGAVARVARAMKAFR